MDQLSIFDMGIWGKYEGQNRGLPAPDGDPPASGEILRDAGIAQAINHAEEVEDGWQSKALGFLFIFIQSHGQFAIEDVRMDAERFNQVPEPPSKRAWGGVAREAAKRGWIRKIGYVQVKNEKAHCANANLWESYW